MPYADPEVRRARARERYASDPEYRKRVGAASREWEKNNPERVRELRKEARLRHRERRKAWDRKHLYGLSDEDYEGMLAAQGDRCAICRRDLKLHVDHDHETGRVRGLLCNGCNRGLGFFGDDGARMVAAASYLEEFEPVIRP